MCRWIGLCMWARSSDIHVMLHLNRQDGLAVAVSEPKHVSHIAKRTVLATSRSPLSCRDRAQPNDGVFRAGLLPQLDELSYGYLNGYPIGRKRFRYNWENRRPIRRTNGLAFIFRGRGESPLSAIHQILPKSLVLHNTLLDFPMRLALGYLDTPFSPVLGS